MSDVIPITERIYHSSYYPTPTPELIKTTHTLEKVRDWLESDYAPSEFGMSSNVRCVIGEYTQHIYGPNYGFLIEFLTPSDFMAHEYQAGRINKKDYEEFRNYCYSCSAPDVREFVEELVVLSERMLLEKELDGEDDDADVRTRQDRVLLSDVTVLRVLNDLINRSF